MLGSGPLLSLKVSLSRRAPRRSSRQVAHGQSGCPGNGVGFLWQEQGGICAYCGSRIDNKDRNDPFFDLPENNNRLEKGTRRREHIAPLATNPEKMLDYYNLLGVCQGNEKKGEIEHHCDKEKDDNEIFILPTMPDCEDFFKYEEVDIFDGIEIIGENTDAINTIKTLNLNFKVLQERRFKPKEKASIIISEAKEL